MSVPSSERYKMKRVRIAAEYKQILIHVDGLNFHPLVEMKAVNMSKRTLLLTKRVGTHSQPERVNICVGWNAVVDVFVVAIARTAADQQITVLPPGYLPRQRLCMHGTDLNFRFAELRLRVAVHPLYLAEGFQRLRRGHLGLASAIARGTKFNGELQRRSAIDNGLESAADL